MIDFGRCTGERSIRIAPLALQSLMLAERGRNNFGIVVGFELGLDVRFLFVVRHANRIGSRFGSLERVRHDQRDVLAVIANDSILEWRAPFFADAFHAWL